MAAERFASFCYISASQVRSQSAAAHVEAPYSAMIQHVPWDLWRYISRFLELSDQAALSLVCKRMAILLASCWAPLNSDRHQRLLFLCKLDGDLPDHRFCSACLKYHRRNSKDERRWLRHQSTSACGERGIPLGGGKYLHWPCVQLALRARYYGSSNYGLHLDTLPGRLEPTLDDTEDVRWQHTLHYWIAEGRLMLVLDSYRSFHGDPQRLSQFSRGYLIDIIVFEGYPYLHVRRLIDAASTGAWLHPKTPGWCPSPIDSHPWYYWSTAHWDPRAGLPGLHWTELSLERRAYGIPEWSNWRYDNKTGQPIDPCRAVQHKSHSMPLLVK